MSVKIIHVIECFLKVKWGDFLNTANLLELHSENFNFGIPISNFT